MIFKQVSKTVHRPNTFYIRAILIEKGNVQEQHGNAFSYHVTIGYLSKTKN